MQGLEIEGSVSAAQVNSFPETGLLYVLLSATNQGVPVTSIEEKI